MRKPKFRPYTIPRQIFPDDPPAPPKEIEVPFVPVLTAPALDIKRQRPDPYEPRRARADHLCLWLACKYAACRAGRHCRGERAECVFDQSDVTRPLLEYLVSDGRM